MNDSVAELRDQQGEPDLIRLASLYDLHEAGTDPEKHRVLNGLDFPMGHSTAPAPPHYR